MSDEEAGTSSAVLQPPLKKRRSTSNKSLTFAQKKSADLTLNNAIDNLDIRHVLKSDPLSSVVLSNYEKASVKKELDHTERTFVVHTVAAHLLILSTSLKDAHFKTVAGKLIKVFPKENEAAVHWEEPASRAGEQQQRLTLRSHLLSQAHAIRHRNTQIQTDGLPILSR
ncbi:uncharacterized protein LOC113216227 isoform X2 [Frankliniella occidentalis]|uniref:Uncharacterized protein LOC113216227 isoform X2 n=1 Tax=Frankliniella occidentalis TaxID=133901 RepID=A0A6J1TE17_FRAOC|nr:uncharacterized protein LOC113216227 isoform X2 [Frankliniella occidentalis]